MKRGFTLIELTFVLVVVGLMSTLALPRVTNLLGINLRTGATQVAGYLQNAYERAILRHERVRVRFDVREGTYWAETYKEPESIPLLDEDTKLDEVITTFEEMAGEPPATPDEKRAADSARFRKMEVGSLKGARLPRGVSFKGVYESGPNQIAEDGTPWVEFSPGGFASKSIVYLTNNSENIYSVIVPPLTGRSRVERGEVRPSDV